MVNSLEIKKLNDLLKLKNKKYKKVAVKVHEQLIWHDITSSVNVTISASVSVSVSASVSVSVSVSVSASVSNSVW